MMKQYCASDARLCAVLQNTDKDGNRLGDDVGIGEMPDGTPVFLHLAQGSAPTFILKPIPPEKLYRLAEKVALGDMRALTHPLSIRALGLTVLYLCALAKNEDQQKGVV